jgi:hypothetical protein
MVDLIGGTETKNNGAYDVPERYAQAYLYKAI